MQKVSFLKRILSYIFPVKISTTSGTINPVLELFLYRNQWQLATTDALYSDGDKYRPLVLAFKALKKHLPNVHQVLVLGTGLGSAVRILHKLHVKAFYTLVELDENVLQMAMELMPFEMSGEMNPLCRDAHLFIETDQAFYDLLIVDIFLGRVVPDFVRTTAFIEKCRQRLNPGGHFVMNFIVEDAAEWDALQASLKKVFHQYQVLSNGINRIILAVNS